VPQAEHKASIILLPFSNISKTDYVDAIVEGLSSSINIHLTKFRDLKIVNYNQIAQFNSAFREITSKNLNVDTRFILCGNVQRDGNVVEVHASLVDTTSMHNIWAEKFDAEVDSGSLFEVQESIAQAIVYRIADDFGLLHRTLLQEMTSGCPLPPAFRKPPCFTIIGQQRSPGATLP
jgi:Predicted integral membrane protein